MRAAAIPRRIALDQVEPLATARMPRIRRRFMPPSPIASEQATGFQLRRLSRFLRRVVRWVWTVPLLLIAYVGLHEMGHVIAVWRVHGTVDQLSIIPRAGEHGFEFGFVEYSNARPGTTWFVAAAPVAIAAVLSFASLAWINRVKNAPSAKLCFLFFFVFPLCDVCHQLTALCLQRHGDLSLLQDRAKIAALVGALFIAALAYLSWNKLFLPLFGNVLSIAEYAVLLTFVVVLHNVSIYVLHWTT